MPKPRATSKTSNKTPQPVVPRPPRPTDPDIDITAVRIVDDRRFTGRFQVIEDEGERRVLGWGFESEPAARRWLENRNKLSSWLRLVLKGE